jgi:hypothetical protein
MRSPGILLLTTLLMLARVTCAQYYDTGEDPASLKWLQINTDRFRVIFPENYLSGGISFTQSLDEAYSGLLSIFPERKFKIPVIIHNFSTQSNGYVAWAPRRMEIYPTPEQNTIPLDPESQLAIHELTHVFQMESLNSGFSKVMSLIVGEQFTGIIASLLPLWFFEGQAVFSESVLTESGRGRNPSFQKQFKALTVDNKSIYKYDKIANGSFRDFIPNHYQSGFQMVTWAMAEYDLHIWNKVLKNTAEQPFTINPVNISLTRSAGLTKKKLYEETFDTLKTIWTKDVTKENPISYEIINPAKRGKFINYYSPVVAGNDSLFAIKTSLSDPPSIVLIDPSNQTEKKIHIPGQLYPWVISYAKGRLAWVEYQSDPRWENRDYSVIKMLDLRTNITTRLSHKSRYLSVSISPDGKKIAAIENKSENINNIVFIDTETGSVIHSVPSPGNVYLQRPQWSEGETKITVIYLTEAGEGIMSYDYTSQLWETLKEAGREDLQSSFLRNDSLFFISSLSGTDNIYLQTGDRKMIPLTRSKFGVSDICLNGEKLIFSDYTATGNNICVLTPNTTPQETDINVSSSSFLLNRFDIKPVSGNSTGSKIYKPEPYRKWQHLFRFHSWMPFYADIEEIKSDPTDLRPGVSIMTQNNLSTLISTIGYEYSAEKNHVLHSRITWKGWYPVLESQLDYGNNPIISKLGESVTDPSEINRGFRFSNTVSLPFRFSSGKFSEFLRPSFTADYKNNYIYLKDEGIYDYGQTILSGRLYFSNYHRSAMRDIYPRWAQTFDLNYTFAPFDKNIYGSSVSLKTAFYIPGILPNNGIKIRLEKEKQVPEKYLFGNRVPFPRGYNNINSRELGLLSVDYVLPLAYPDFNLFSLLYLKRIRTGLFYDYALGTGNTYYELTANGWEPDHYNDFEESFRSFGFELLADFHIFRLPFMISGGVQTAWKNFGEKPSFELLFNIDLFGMTLGKREI